MKQPCVYILTNQRNGTLYVGVTANLVRRISVHRENLLSGFTQKYKIHRLVYYEYISDMIAAIKREKQLKSWGRWKIELIEKNNPEWRDLYNDLLG
jgi:putative endonuclease